MLKNYFILPYLSRSWLIPARRFFDEVTDVQP